MSAPNFHASLDNPGMFTEPALARLGRLFAECAFFQTGVTADPDGNLKFQVEIRGDDLRLYMDGGDAVASGISGDGRIPDAYDFEGTQAKIDALSAGDWPFNTGV